jgi:transcriptional regulator of acetoin/glycerol metabolism
LPPIARLAGRLFKQAAGGSSSLVDAAARRSRRRTETRTQLVAFPEVRAERILAGQAAARERGIRWGGSIRGRRIRATVEQIAVIRRLRSEGGEIAAIARATGLSRPTIYRILAEDCNASSGFSDGESVGRVVCGTGPV